MFKTLLLLIFLGGCAYTPTTLQKAQECGTGPECDLLWAEWNKQEEKKLAKEKWRAMFKCPDDMIFYCGDPYCMGAPKTKPPRKVELIRSGCISQANFEDMLRRL